MQRQEMCVKFQQKKSGEGRQLGRSTVADEKKIIILISKKQGMMTYTEFVWLGLSLNVDLFICPFVIYLIKLFVTYII